MDIFKAWPSKMLNNTECFPIKSSTFCRATLYDLLFNALPDNCVSGIE